MQICGTSMHFHCLIVIFIKLCYILLITKCNEVSHFSSMCTVLHSVSIKAREKALCITPGLVFFHTLTHKLQLYNYFIIKITPNIQSIFRSNDDDFIISPYLSTQCQCVKCYTCTFVLITQLRRFGARFLLIEEHILFCIFLWQIF